jgi:hypothetical protein
MDGVCSTNGEHKCVQRFGGESGRKVNLCDLGVDRNGSLSNRMGGCGLKLRGSEEEQVVVCYKHGIYRIKLRTTQYKCVYCPMWSRDSAVGIAARYGLDGPGIEFSAPVRTGSDAQPASYTMATGSFPKAKRPRRGVNHPPHLAPNLKKE